MTICRGEVLKARGREGVEGEAVILSGAQRNRRVSPGARGRARREAFRLRPAGFARDDGVREGGSSGRERELSC